MTRMRIHPGEILRLEFVEPMGLTLPVLASWTGIDLMRLACLQAELCDITSDDARGLSVAFGTSLEFWLNLQAAYDGHTRRSHVAYAIRAHASYAFGVLAGVADSLQAHRACGRLYAMGERCQPAQVSAGFDRGQRIPVPGAWWK